MVEIVVMAVAVWAEQVGCDELVVTVVMCEEVGSEGEAVTLGCDVTAEDSKEGEPLAMAGCEFVR